MNDQLAIRPLPPSINLASPQTDDEVRLALVIASLGSGLSIIQDPQSPLVEVDIRALSAIGVRINRSLGSIFVQGAFGCLQSPYGVLDCGESETTFCVMTAMLSFSKTQSIITGGSSNENRSVAQVTDAMMQLGAVVESVGPGMTSPIVNCGQKMQGGRCIVIGNPSLISAIMLTAPMASQPTMISVKSPILNPKLIDLTYQAMAQAGIDLDVSDNYLDIVVRPGTYRQIGPTSHFLSCGTC